MSDVSYMAGFWLGFLLASGLICAWSFITATIVVFFWLGHRPRISVTYVEARRPAVNNKVKN